MNFFIKYKKTISAVIVAVLVLAMVVTTIMPYF